MLTNADAIILVGVAAGSGYLLGYLRGRIAEARSQEGGPDV